MRYPLPSDLMDLARHDPTVLTVIRMGEAAELPYFEMLEKMAVSLATEKQTLYDMLLKTTMMVTTTTVVVQEQQQTPIDVIIK